jgi:hypothetical protein
VEGITGRYFYDSHVIPAAPQATDKVVARKLWDVSAEMVHFGDDLPAKTQRSQIAAIQTGKNSALN